MKYVAKIMWQKIGILLQQINIVSEPINFFNEWKAFLKFRHKLRYKNYFLTCSKSIDLSLSIFKNRTAFISGDFLKVIAVANDKVNGEQEKENAGSCYEDLHPRGNKLVVF